MNQIMFVDRHQELNILEQKYSSGRAEFFVLYGRRRVGKTELLRHFCQSKLHIFYVADLGTQENSLREFTRQVSEFTLGNPDTLGTFPSWDAGFEFLVKNKPNERLLIIIDEFTYLIDTDGAVPSIFQRIWDTLLKNSNVMLILCGSYIGMIEKYVLAQSSPLYGRRTGQWKLEPLSLWDTQKLVPALSMDNLVRIYATLGGIPLYFQQFRDDLSLFDNIERYILSPGNFLYEEARFLLLDELREPNRYFSIIEAIAMGKTKLNEIAQETKIDASHISYYLKTLEELGLIERKVPATEKRAKKSKQGIYLLRDQYLRFWFRFVYPNRSSIERGRIDRVREQLEQQIDQFVGPVFEWICQEYLWRPEAHPKLDFVPDQVGSWWSRLEEIDVVAFTGKSVLWGECKWTNQPVGLGLLHDLKRKVEIAQKSIKDRKWRVTKYALFSRSGFTGELVEQAKAEDILLLSVEEMLEAQS